MLRRLFGVLCDHYFDDFIGAELERFGGSAESTIERLHVLVGLRLADKPSKVTKGGTCAPVLGRNLHVLPPPAGGVLVTSNDRSRSRTLDAIDEVLNAGAWTAAHASKLAGRTSICSPSPPAGSDARGYGRCTAAQHARAPGRRPCPTGIASA